MCITILLVVYARIETEDIICGGVRWGEKGKGKESMFCRIHFFKMTMALKILFTLKEIQEFKYGKWGAINAKSLCL